MQNSTQRLNAKRSTGAGPAPAPQAHVQPLIPRSSHVVARLLHLQRTAGNAAVMRLVHRHLAERSTAAGPGDLAHNPAPHMLALGGASTSATAGSARDASLGQRIRTAAGGGEPLGAAIQHTLETALGADLESVRIHHDSEADSLARAVDALAFTTGSNIFFRRGAYNPGSPGGLRLLAHEAIHTLQQAAGPVSGTPQPGGVLVSGPNDRFEHAADHQAADVAMMAGQVDEHVSKLSTSCGLSGASILPPGSAPIYSQAQEAHRNCQWQPGPGTGSTSSTRLPATAGRPAVQRSPEPTGGQSAEGEPVYRETRGGDFFYGTASGLLRDAFTGIFYIYHPVTGQYQPYRDVRFYDPVKRILLDVHDPITQLYRDQYGRFYVYEHGLYIPRLVQQVPEIQGSRFLLPLPKNAATKVIVQADYMSGDRYGIAAALIHQPEWGVLIISSTRTLAKGVDLLRFYVQLLVAQGASPLRATLYDAGERAPEEVYHQRDVFGDFEGSIQPDAETHQATMGTRLVAETMTHFGPETTHQYFAEQVLGEEMGRLRAARSIAQFLRRINLVPGRYAFIWVKTGSWNAEKAYHFADPGGVTQMILVALRSRRMPVLIGDRLDLPLLSPNVPVHRLWNFWEREDFPLKHEGRLGQLKFYRYLATDERYDVVNIGMRSGGMEGPALTGMPTICLEEQGSSQAVRLEQWLNVMPNFHRIIIDAPPGASQKLLLAQALIKRGETIASADMESQELTRLSETLGSENPAEVLGAREQYIAFIREKAEALQQAAAEDPGFSLEDLLVMNALLGMSRADLRSPLRSAHPKLSARNPGLAEQYATSLAARSASSSHRH